MDRFAPQEIMKRLYVLDGKKPVQAPDFMQYAMCMGDDNLRRVGLDVIGEVHVSTVFIGMDHQFRDGGPPILFETMVFGMDAEGYGRQWRYSTWEEAAEGHVLAVEWVKSVVALAEEKAAAAFKANQEGP